MNQKQNENWNVSSMTHRLSNINTQNCHFFTMIQQNEKHEKLIWLRKYKSINMIFSQNETKLITSKTKHATTRKQLFGIKRNQISQNHTKNSKNSSRILTTYSIKKNKTNTELFYNNCSFRTSQWALKIKTKSSRNF